MRNIIFQEDGNLPAEKIYILQKTVENTLSFNWIFAHITGAPLIIEFIITKGTLHPIGCFTFFGFYPNVVEGVKIANNVIFRT